MSTKSNDNGRAFEYITIIELRDQLEKFRKVVLEENSSLNTAKKAYEKTDATLQYNLKKSAEVAVSEIFNLEPLIFENDGDILVLKIQKDASGEFGDVRDILIIRSNIGWEIGLSLKHNHFAVKHSRLGKNLDFGKAWFNIPCSTNYWDDVKPVFDYLSNEKTKSKKWSELNNKVNDVYIPLLNAFVKEVERAATLNSAIPQKMVEYLLGKFDFYKIISIDSKQLVQFLTFNLRGTLNKSSNKSRHKTSIPISELPTRIIKIGLIPNSTNTVEMIMDKGWSFTFRIHNASSFVEPSLKFDIRLIGMPTTIITINCTWK